MGTHRSARPLVPDRAGSSVGRGAHVPPRPHEGREVLGQPAPVPDDFDPGAYKGGFRGGDEEPVMTMEISPDVARWFPEYYPLRDRRPLRGGWERVELIASSNEWAASLLLQLGAGVRKVEPAELETAARELAKGSLRSSVMLLRGLLDRVALHVHELVALSARGERERERRALAPCRVDPDAAVVHVHQLRAEVQAHAGAAVLPSSRSRRSGGSARRCGGCRSKRSRSLCRRRRRAARRRPRWPEPTRLRGSEYLSAFSIRCRRTRATFVSSQGHFKVVRHIRG